MKIFEVSWPGGRDEVLHQEKIKDDDWDDGKDEIPSYDNIDDDSADTGDGETKEHVHRLAEILQKGKMVFQPTL